MNPKKDPEKYFSEEQLEEIYTKLQEYTHQNDNSIFEDENVFQYISMDMEYYYNNENHNYTRVEPITETDITYYQSQKGKQYNFHNTNFASFSRYIEATNEIIHKWYQLEPCLAIFRTNGPIKHFEMSSFSDDDWQEEEIVPAEGWTIINVTDISEQYPYNEKVILIDIEATQ